MQLFFDGKITPSAPAGHDKEEFMKLFQRQEWKQAMSDLQANPTRSTELRQERDKKRRSWLVNGVTRHGLNLEDLKRIHDQYERLDLVPQHYNYPQFFRQREKPNFERQIEVGRQR